MADDEPADGSVHDHLGGTSSFTRRREPRIKRWLLFDGDRAHVAGGLLLGVFLSLILLGAVWPVQYRRLLAETTQLQTVFNTLLGGVILLVSIVVAIASVGISQELTSLGDQYERVETAVEFRSEIEEHEEVDAGPARPGQVIVAMLRTIQQRAEQFEATVAEDAEPDLRDEVAVLKEDVETNVEELSGTLDSVQPGTTDELLVGLDYDSARQLHQTYRIREVYADRLSEEQRAVLDELADALREFTTGREYFKTLYYEREFSDLSTALLVVSLPVIVLITYVMLALDAGSFPEVTVVGLSPLSVFISLAYTIALGPYVILTAYVLRAASVTKRTPAVGPFVLRTDRQRPFDGSDLRDDDS